MNALDAFKELESDDRRRFERRYRLTLDDHVAGWAVWGDKWQYLGPVYVGTFYFSMTVEMGLVKQRKDGRFDYWVKPTRGRRDWPVKRPRQGVAGTLEEAKLKVEEGWS